jgi:hypothetical protein
MTLPYQPHSETSRQAAEDAVALVPNARQRVFNLIHQSNGLTDEEVCDRLSMNPSTERPRRIELERAGLVRDSGNQRPNLSGSLAVIWVGVPGAIYQESVFKIVKPETSLTGDAKAIEEIKRAIPERKRSPELVALLERLDFEASRESEQRYEIGVSDSMLEGIFDDP